MYLLGCNTLSGSAADSRTPEQYYEVLIRDGLQPEAAASVVAARYGQIGKTNRSLFENIFSKTPHIYGFYSIGPSGKTMTPYLNKYLNSQAPYENWLSQLDSQKKNKLYSGPNTKLKSMWSDMNYTETAGSQSGNSRDFKSSNQDNVLDFYCSFIDENKTADDKLKIISQLFLDNSGGYKFYIDELNDFFYKNPVSWFTKFESVDLLKKIKAKSELKSQFNDIISQSSFMPIKIKVLTLAQKTEIFQKNDVKKQIEDIVWPLLFNQTSYQSNLLCTLSDALIEPISEIVKLEQLKGHLNDSQVLKTLKCLKPKDSNLLITLIGQIENIDPNIADLSEQVVYTTKSTDIAVLRSLVSATARSQSRREIYLRNYFYHLINNKNLDLNFYNFVLDQAAMAPQEVQTQMISLFRYHVQSDKQIIKRLKREFNFRY